MASYFNEEYELFKIMRLSVIKVGNKTYLLDKIVKNYDGTYEFHAKTEDE